MTTAIYPGTFDPVTRGHLDIIDRASSIFETLIVAVGHNPAKNTLFSLRDREAMLVKETAHLPNVEVAVFRGLIINFAKKRGVSIILRGLRSADDLQYELQMAATNRCAGDVETIFIPSRPQFSLVSAQLIKEIAARGGDVGAMVTPSVETRLRAKRRQKGRPK